MPGSEVKDIAASALKAAAAAEDFAAGERTNKNDGIGRRDVKGFAVHFRLGNHKGFAQAAGDGVRRLNHPNPFRLAIDARRHAAGSAHQLSEDLGTGAPMQRDEAHPLIHDAFVDALGDGIFDHLMGGVSPPDQHIGLVEDRFIQSMFRFVQRRHLYGEALFAQWSGDGGVDAVGVNFR